MYDPLKMGIEPCKCGRLSNKVHCPKCGSYEVRARSKKNKRMLTNGEIEDVQVYRCRVDGIMFDDWDWQNGNCYAIPYESRTTRALKELSRSYGEPGSKKAKKKDREMHDLLVNAERIKFKSKPKIEPEPELETNETEDQETKRLKAEIASIDQKIPPVPNWDDLIKKGATIEQIESVKKMRITKGWPV